ncbi:lysozyme [Actinopolyspora sp. H202]|uniref:lysozyme n=1 Tax=Actinopolyspora sp. H202 TaxID=1500456 RepID=UPI003EE49EB9
MHGSRGCGRARALTVALAALFGTALLLGSSAQAVSESSSVRERAGHEMGSQIREHEGGDPSAAPAMARNPSVKGMDVSGHQNWVNWRHWWNKGMRFAYVKATEGTGYTSPDFNHQYTGSYKVGMIRGAYHFALPDRSGGAAQARYFVANGGGWSDDGKTLPGALDIEYNPYGPTCYGKSKRAMTAWIRDFSDTYRKLTGRYPTIYTSTSWWNKCVASDFGDTNPLWVARYNDYIGPLPHGWGFHTFWQYTSSPLDKNLFNGSYKQLERLARG